MTPMREVVDNTVEQVLQEVHEADGAKAAEHERHGREHRAEKINNDCAPAPSYKCKLPKSAEVASTVRKAA